MSATTPKPATEPNGPAQAKAGGLDAVRREVRALLEASPAFRALSPNERKVFAQDMIQVGSFLADPEWLDDSRPVRARSLAGSDVGDLRKRVAKQSEGIRPNDFQAAAVKQGVEAFGALVKTVDFPAFVSGLVQGVFNAVVDASIQQMRAYAELMRAAAMTTEQFARTNISGSDARQYLLARYPDALEPYEEDGQRRVRVREDYEGDFTGPRDYGLPSGDLGDPDAENALVAAVSKEMAAERQQMMATMVLLGINRIVVTNGRINAKVVFDVEASDEALRRARAESETSHAVQTHVGYSSGLVGSIFGGPSGSISSQHATRVASSVDDTSESKAQLKAQLTGEVRLSFKSETFPLEKLADNFTIGALNRAAEPNNRADRTQTGAQTPARR
jgi:hypothetical protein